MAFFFFPKAQTSGIHVQNSQCTVAFTPTWFCSAAVCELGGPWHLVWMLWKITTSRGRLAKVACAGLLPCTKAASHGCLRSLVSWLVFTIEWKLDSFSTNRIISEMVGCAEKQMVARQWTAEVGCCCPHFVNSYLSTRETTPAFSHVYIKCAYCFGAAVISLTRDVKKLTKLQPCYSSFQERISVCF